MTITVTPSGGGVGITLGDDSAGDFIVVAPLLDDVRTVQVDPLFESDTPFSKGRGNRMREFSWVVDREHADAEAAASFALTHANGIPEDVSINIDTGANSFTIEHAVIARVTVLQVTGRSTTVRYTVTGASAWGAD